MVDKIFKIRLALGNLWFIEFINYYHYYSYGNGRLLQLTRHHVFLSAYELFSPIWGNHHIFLQRFCFCLHSYVLKYVMHKSEKKNTKWSIRKGIQLTFSSRKIKTKSFQHLTKHFAFSCDYKEMSNVCSVLPLKIIRVHYFLGKVLVVTVLL